jgi:hypothetical protein
MHQFGSHRPKKDGAMVHPLEKIPKNRSKMNRAALTVVVKKDVAFSV